MCRHGAGHCLAGDSRRRTVRPIAGRGSGFFAEEAATFAGLTAARSPYVADEAPATIHIVTTDQLNAFATFHLWDALRGTPGVGVVSANDAHGVIGIRGLTKVGNNRILVLLNGRRVSDADSESLTHGNRFRSRCARSNESNWLQGQPLPCTAAMQLLVSSTSSPQSRRVFEVGALVAPSRRPTAHREPRMSLRPSWAHRVSTDGRVGLEGRRLDRATESLQATRALRIHGTATGRIGPQTTYRMDGGCSHQEGGVSLGLLGVGIERGARGFIQASVEHGAWTSHTRLYGGSKELVNAPSAGRTRFSSTDVSLQRQII